MNHHDHDLDRDWAALLESLEPDAAELAAAERELQELDAVAPLPAAEIDAMVAAAVGVRSVTPVVPIRSAKRHVRRMLLLAALLFVALPMTVAWFARGLWPERVHSVVHMSFGEALAICIEPENDDDTRLSAMALLLNECDLAITVLAGLRVDADEQLSSAATDQLRRARQATKAPALERPKQVAGDVRTAAPIARDAQEPSRRRLAAIEVLGAHLQVGARALVFAHLQSDEAEQQRQLFVTFLQQALEH